MSLLFPHASDMQGDGTLVAKSWNDNQPGMSPYWGTTTGNNGNGPFTLNVRVVWGERGGGGA
jgi:hypothetical protein